MNRDPQHIGVDLERILDKGQAPAPPELNTPDRSEGRREAAQAVALERWLAMVPPKLAGAVLEDLAGVVGGADITTWATSEHPGWAEGVNLLLIGATGVGKSHAAVAAARPAIATGRSCLYWPAADLMAALDWQVADHRRTMADAQRCALLVLDDLGAEAPNEWTRKQWYQLVNHRWNEDLATIANTNLEPADLEEAIGGRTYSRLVGGAVAVRLVGPDRRRTHAT